MVREAWLRGFKFYVDERVIVPRSFIAELLDFDEEGEHGLQPWIEHPELINSAADICTGSGCLGILLANAFPDAAIDVVDISADAIAVCNINIANYGLQDQITAIQSDMFSALKDPNGKPKCYDLIISNLRVVDLAGRRDIRYDRGSLLRRRPRRAFVHRLVELDLRLRSEAVKAELSGVKSLVPAAVGEGGIPSRLASLVFGRGREDTVVRPCGAAVRSASNPHAARVVIVRGRHGSHRILQAYHDLRFVLRPVRGSRVVVHLHVVQPGLDLTVLLAR